MKRLYNLGIYPEWWKLPPPAAAEWPAIDALIADIRATVNSIAARAARGEAPSWEAIVEPQFAAMEYLDRAWGVVSHLTAVVNNPPLREAYNANLRKVTELHTQLSQDSRLHACYRALRAAAAFPRLAPAQQRLIDNELRDFRLGGAELGGADKARFLAISEEQSALMAKFEENVLDATNGWELGGPGPMITVFAPNGRVLETHPVPADRPTNCCFGGADMTTLFVTSVQGHLFRAETGRVGWAMYP